MRHEEFLQRKKLSRKISSKFRFWLKLVFGLKILNVKILQFYEFLLFCNDTGWSNSYFVKLKGSTVMGLVEGGVKKSGPATEKTHLMKHLRDPSPCNDLENDRTTSTSRCFMG